MSINHNRIKVADLEKNQPNKILITNTDGELEFSDMYNALDYSILVNDLTSGGTTKALTAEMGKTLQETKVDKVTGERLINAAEINKLGNLSGVNTGDQILPTTLPASDVYAWAKEPSKPTYTNAEVGLGNVDNTSDVNKPVSTATQTVLNSKEDKSNKNIANGYAGLGSDGKLISSQLPSITISNTFVVASEAAMLSLTVEIGDVAVRTDLNKSFILKGANPTVLGDWQELLSPTDSVSTVFGRNGSVTAQTGDYTADQITETASRKFQTANQQTFNDATSSIQTQLNNKEASFTKNTAFNKNFGTTIGTVAEGNDARILNGQTAYSWGNHAGLYPSLSGSGASGTWGINISGSSGSAAYLPTNYIGGQQLNPQTYFNIGIGVKVAMTASLGMWSDTLWINGYAGGDVKDMCALHFWRNGQPRMFISSQLSDSTSYGTPYEIITDYNASSKSVGYATNSGNSGTLGGVDISRIVNGSNARGRSTGMTGGNANTSDTSNPSGFFYGNSVTGMPNGDWYNWINVAGADWSGSDGYGFQICHQFWDSDLRVRKMTSGSWNGWRTILDSGNYQNFTYHVNGLSIGTAGARTGSLSGSNSIAIGDSDTGFMQDGDGILRTYCNNALVKTETSSEANYNGILSVNGELHVGKYNGSSILRMWDSDEGTRILHCNSNRIGFLTEPGAWGSYCNDDGSWRSESNISAAGDIFSSNAVYGSRLFAGYDSGVVGSISCSNWFRTNGATGWYNQDYSGGIWMRNSTFVEVYGGKRFKVENFLHLDANYGHSLVGLYDSQRYQGVWMMGDGYKLSDDGTSTANAYGIAWTHPNVGGQSKSGLSHQMLILEAGVTKTAIGTGIWTAGNIYSQSDIIAYASSDRRLKDNIKKIENPLEKISKINGYTFDWNKNQDTYTGHDIGVIAQEVEAILPEIVTTRENGYKAVKYEKLVPLLIESIKSQQEKIEQLKSELDQIKQLLYGK